ncbi:hypothetical protein Dimus_030280 [Dionaea muscipula]
MDTVQWQQETVMKPMEDMVTNHTATFSSSKKPTSTSLERRVRPQKDQALNCPRCNSTNTKFCYYNNYSLTQPRYFCKTCRRYWTQGGTLRNIPVGGGSRKNKRSSSSSSFSASSGGNSTKISLPDLAPSNSSSQPSIALDGQDLNLSFPPNPDFRGLCEFIHLPNIENPLKLGQITTNSTTSGAISTNISALELLTGLTSSRTLMSSFMSMPTSDQNPVFSSGFGLQGDFKPSHGFNHAGIGSGYGNVNLHGVQESTGNGKVLFPLFEDLKQVSASTSDQDNDQSREQRGDSSGYWSGMLGGAGSW